MLPTHTANLPPEQQQRLHADFLTNERAYLQMRDALLARHRGQWVAVHQGQVIAADANLLVVMDVAAQSGGHPYVALVGAEEQAVFRVRRAAFAYDAACQPFALPRVTATFSNFAGTHSQTIDDVIPDTGADLSVLPAGDCMAIDLYNSPYLTGLSSGVLGAAVTALIYRGTVEIAGHRFAALIQPIVGGQERIVGRDVLNSLRVLFDGPAGQVIVDP